MQPSFHRHNKEIQITVYVVNSRQLTKQASNQERRATKSRHDNSGGCYDRKAQLLLYSRQMRAIARRKQPPAISKPQTPQKAIEFIQIAVSKKPQPPNKLTEVIQIAAMPKPRQLIAAANHRAHHFAIKSIQNSAVAKAKPNAAEIHKINRTPSWKVVPVEDKPADAKLPPLPPPSCFGDWTKFLLPDFIKRRFYRKRAEKNKSTKIKKPIHSLNAKMNAIFMSSRMEKERIGVMAKFFSAIEKHM